MYKWGLSIVDNSKFARDEMILIGLAIAFFLLSIINFFYPISPSKISACSMSALLIGLSEMSNIHISFLEVAKEYAIKQAEQIYQMTMAAERNNEHFEPSVVGDIRYESIKNYTLKYGRLIRHNKILGNISLALSIIILIIGLSTNFLLVNATTANSATLLSIGIIFLSLIYKKLKKRHIDAIEENMRNMNGLLNAIVDDEKIRPSSLI